MIYYLVAALFNIIIGGSLWVFIRYFLLILANYFTTHYSQYNGNTATFMIGWINFGIWIIIMIPTAIFTWTQAQRAKIENEAL